MAGDQNALEGEWKRGLKQNHDVTFDRLLCLNNMPISRYLEWLIERDQLDAYMQRLTNAFNPGAIDGLMCRNTLSISWDGRLFDCDFNQQLEMEVDLPEGKRPNVHDLDAEVLAARRIVTARHCFGCTAGQGSSCGGSTA
ncbi:MAG: radical SAM/Cys-rich protein [Bradymonadia bacterium]